jgi:hypothetical protein
MSYYVTNENSFLDIKNAHLRVTGNVHTDVLKVGSIGFQPSGSNIPGTVNFTNVTTGVTTSSNLDVGGTLNLGTVELSASTHTLDHITARGNVTSTTVQFDNATTGLVTTANVEVGGELTVSGNVTVGTANLFVDTVNNRVGIGTTTPNVLLELSSATGSATITPTELRLSSSTDAGDWDTTTPYARLAFYTGDVTADAPGVMASIGAVASSADGGENTRLAFFTAEPHVERMCVDRYGNVGIGTTNPNSLLDVSDTTGETVIRISGLTVQSNAFIYMTETPERNYGGVLHYSGTGSPQGLRFGHLEATTTPRYDMAIDRTSGNVGIGTTSPAIQLDVHGTNAKLGRVLTGNVHEVYKRDSVYIGRWDDTTLSNGFSGMRCRVDTHNALGYGSYSNQTEVGFYAWGNSISSSRQVFAINCYGNGNMIGTLTQSSTGTTSDDRIKYNEEDITSPLTLISQLNPQKYEKIVSVAVSEKKGIWIPTDEEWESVKSEYTYVDEFGFIAQDVRAVPELSFLVNGEETRTDTNTLTPEEYSNLTSEEQVTYTPSYVYESNTITQQEYSNLTHEEQGVCTTQYTKQIETQTPLSLNYNGLFVLAIGAIKELKAENDAIKARLDALENA